MHRIRLTGGPDDGEEMVIEPFMTLITLNDGSKYESVGVGHSIATDPAISQFRFIEREDK